MYIVHTSFLKINLMITLKKKLLMLMLTNVYYVKYFCYLGCKIFFLRNIAITFFPLKDAIVKLVFFQPQYKKNLLINLKF